MDRSVEELANSTTAFYKQMILLFDSTNNDWILYKKRQKGKVFVRSFFSDFTTCDPREGDTTYLTKKCRGFIN